MIQASYTSEALGAFVSQPQDRSAGVRALCEKMGAQFESLDFCLGDYDVMVIYSAADDITATAIALAACAAGHLKTFKTTKLLSQDDFLAASQKAHGAGYQAPSRG
jgi:uncharacterized protein with GYD domain